MTLYGIAGDRTSARLLGVFGKLRADFGTRCSWRTIPVTRRNRATLLDKGVRQYPAIVITTGTRIAIQAATLPCYRVLSHLLSSLCSPSPSTARTHGVCPASC